MGRIAAAITAPRFLVWQGEDNGRPATKQARTGQNGARGAKVDRLWAELAQELQSAQQKEAAAQQRDAQDQMPAIETPLPESMDHVPPQKGRQAVEPEKEPADAKARDRLLLFSGGCSVNLQFSKHCLLSKSHDNIAHMIKPSD